jgi:membrane dipeptidase
MNTNTWADAAGDTAEWGGLNDFGVEVIREMNRLGMMIDVSHVSDDTYFDVLRETRAPVIASHSCARRLCDHFRNMSDEMLQALAENGGVVGINFYSGYLDSSFANAASPLWDVMRKERSRLREEFKDDDEGLQRAYRAYREQQVAKLPAVPISLIADHIMHVISVAGIDHVAFGSDFDGVSFLPEGMQGCQDVPKITEMLVDRGLSEADIRKVLGENILRVMEEVERTSAQIQSSQGDR